MEKISFLSSGQKIVGTLISPKKKELRNPGVIFFHGMTSSEKGYIPIAEDLADRGIVCLTLSLRGHGESEGNFNTLTVNDAVTDGLAAYDFFTKLGLIDNKRVGVCGTSVGAAIAAMLSAQAPIKSMLLRAPASYTSEMLSMTFQQIMAMEGQVFQKITNIKATPSVSAISHFKGDLLVIISEKDTVIPTAIPTHYLSEAKLARSKKLVQISGAQHNITGIQRSQFIDEVVKWFTATL